MKVCKIPTGGGDRTRPKQSASIKRFQTFSLILPNLIHKSNPEVKTSYQILNPLYRKRLGKSLLGCSPVVNEVLLRGKETGFKPLNPTPNYIPPTKFWWGVVSTLSFGGSEIKNGRKSSPKS
jgi:hypothetical protein